ncbi:MAG TPA: hypothetical protein VFW62_04235, partial [bacterium]|nr:hypothetical protein [bacterium]
MTPISVRQILEDYPKAAQAEEVSPWLLNLDENQDGTFQPEELRNPEGQLRCDFRVRGLGAQRWKKLEAILVGRSLVKEDPDGCPVKKGASPGRMPTASAGLYRSNAYDFVFQLGKGIGLQAVLDFLKDAGYPATQQKNFHEATLASGRLIRIETHRGHLQKIHYLDAQGKASILCRLEFWELLRAAGRFEDFFAANPYYKQEREAWGRYHSVVYTYGKTPTLSRAQAAKKGWKGVLLFPDIHGSWERIQALEKMVRTEKLDWLAIEMLPQNLQSELDDFLTAKASSTAWREAKRKLQNYLQPFWAPYFKKISKPEENPYYQLLLLCRRRGLKVVALDAPASYTQAADTKMSTLSIGTRNRIWAEGVPAKGRGIVYG